MFSAMQFERFFLEERWHDGHFLFTKVWCSRDLLDENKQIRKFSLKYFRRMFLLENAGEKFRNIFYRGVILYMTFQIQ
jgi:hypothetical protein